LLNNAKFNGCLPLFQLIPSFPERMMACRGVFFALNSEQRQHLLALNTDEARLEYIQEHIEGAWDAEHLLETDKAWDAIHRCLTDGSLTIAPARNPLGKLIVGGRQLYSNKQSYIVNLVDANELPEISAALKAISKQWMKEQYEKLRDTDYPQELISSEDWEYTWEYFSGLPDFISRAQEEQRSVIFTVDQ
jgi:hypothetical protein